MQYNYVFQNDSHFAGANVLTLYLDHEHINDGWHLTGCVNHLSVAGSPSPNVLNAMMYGTLQWTRVLFQLVFTSS